MQSKIDIERLMHKTKLIQRPRAKRITVPEEVKTKVVRLRVTQIEFNRIKQLADEKGCTMSFLIFDCLNKL